MFFLELFTFQLCSPNFLSPATAYSLQQTCCSLQGVIPHLIQSDWLYEKSARRIQSFLRKFHSEEIKHFLHRHVQEVRQFRSLPWNAYSILYVTLWKRCHMVWPYPFQYYLHTKIKCEIQLDHNGKIVYMWHFMV